jgi:hypothetical protein
MNYLIWPKVQIISSRYGTRVFLFTQFFDINVFSNFSKNSQFYTRKRNILKKNLIFEVEKSTKNFPRTERAWVDRHPHWYHVKPTPLLPPPNPFKLLLSITNILCLDEIKVTEFKSCFGLNMISKSISTGAQYVTLDNKV